MPPAAPIPSKENKFDEIADLVLASLHRLRQMATAMENQIHPEEMKSSDLTRAVRTVAHLYTLIIKHGGDVVGDVKAQIAAGKKKGQVAA